MTSGLPDEFVLYDQFDPDRPGMMLGRTVAVDRVLHVEHPRVAGIDADPTPSTPRRFDGTMAGMTELPSPHVTIGGLDADQLLERILAGLDVEVSTSPPPKEGVQVDIIGFHLSEHSSVCGEGYDTDALVATASEQLGARLEQLGGTVHRRPAGVEPEQNRKFLDQARPGQAIWDELDGGYRHYAAYLAVAQPA